MSISSNISYLFILAILFVTNDLCFCRHAKQYNFNHTLDVDGFTPAVATWYGNPTGSGSGGACSLADDVANAPYNGMITAGNQFLFKSGVGCGNCFKVKCTNKDACSGNPIIVTLTDECPGECNTDAIHFDLSGKAFGSLAKPGQDSVLRNFGRIDVHYTRVDCNYPSSNIIVKIDTGSNPYYLAFVVEVVDGDGGLSQVEIKPSNAGSFVGLQRSWGETWKFDVGSGVTGPYSIRLTNSASKTVVLDNVIPQDWAAGKTYHSSINFS